MASIRKDVILEADPGAVWGAVRDWGALHERLVRGFVTATELDGEDRLVTFFNGATVRERFVELDDDTRRLVWAIDPETSALGLTHHNASTQVLTEPDGRARLVWVADLLPHDIAPTVEAMMDRGIAAMRRTLEQRLRRT